MNTVSILLYVADLGSNLIGLVVFLWVCFLMILIGIAIFISDDENKVVSYHNPSGFSGELYQENLKKYKLPLYTCLLLFTTLLVNLIPSKETMHLIIASELSEEAINSEITSEFKNVLIDTIKSYKKD